MSQRILVVDDNDAIRTDIVRILRASDPNLDIVEAADGIDALKLLNASPFDVILTDLEMPRMDGLKLMAAVRQSEGLKLTPIIMITSHNQLHDKLVSFEHGAHDFLTKPYHPAELVARTRVMLQLRAHMRAIEQQAIVDPLTGLYNQNYLRDAITRELKRCQRYDLSLSCLMIDIDHFKTINDSYGHLAGDDVLRAVGQVLQRILRGYDFAVRYGGDEFMVVLAQNNPLGATYVAERIREAVAQHPWAFLRDAPSTPSVSIGVASTAPGTTSSPTTVIEAADQALYQAKRQGRNRVVAVQLSAPTG